MFNEKVETNGTCTRCQDYFISSSDGTSCVAAQCDNVLFKVKTDGSCEACPPLYMRSAENINECFTPKCPDIKREKIVSIETDGQFACE